MFRRHAETAAAGLLIAAAAAAFYAPIGAAGGALPQGHDIIYHLVVADGVEQAIADGDPYPRWIDSASNGQGAPILVGYSPMSPMMVALASLVSGDLGAGFGIAILLMSFLSGVAYYAFARRMARPIVAGVGAALYVLMPYPIVTFYIRFAFAEYAALIWVPLVLKYTLDVLYGARRRAWFGLAASFGALCMTHVVVAFVVLVAFLPIFLFAWRRPERWVLAGAALLAGVVLASAYVIPLLAGRDAIHSGVLLGEEYKFLLFTDFSPRLNQVITTQLAPMIVPIVALFVLRRRLGKPIFACLLACAWVTVLVLPIAAPIWESVEVFGYLRYPFRFLAIQAAFVPLAVLWARRPAWVLLGVVLCAAPLYIAHKNTTEVVRFVSARDHLTQALERGFVVAEHVPIQVRDPQDPGRAERVAVDGQGSAEVIEWRPQSRRFRVHIQQPSARVRVGTLHFPGWAATVDGRRRPIHVARDTGRMEVEVPEGEHELSLELRRTLDQEVGETLSLAACALFAALLLLVRRDKASW